MGCEYIAAHASAALAQKRTFAVRLAERGVHCVQGWYFSRAQPVQAIEQVLRRFQEAQAAPLSVHAMRALLA